MLVLGLDPSLTNYGWAYHDTNTGDCPDRGRFSTPSRQTFVHRYITLRDSLRDLIRRTPPDRIGIESPVFHELWSEGMYGLFLYSCEALTLEKMDVVFFTPHQIKAHARAFLDRPQGWKMLKPDMVEAAKKATGTKGRWNHNEADAYWAARVASRFWEFYEGEISESDLTQVERDNFLKTHTYQRGKKAGKTVKSGIIHREEDRFFLWSEG